jgi:hypothetical protein
MANRFPLDIADDLTIAIGTNHVRLTPEQGFQACEMLARKSIRKAMLMEAEDLSPGITELDEAQQRDRPDSRTQAGRH